MTAPYTSPVQAPRRAYGLRSRVWVIATSLLLLFVFILGGIGALTAESALSQYKEQRAAKTAYSAWPPAGTASGQPGQEAFHANAVVAMTCRNGQAHLDQKMLVDAGSANGKSPQPDWYVSFYTHYNQASSNRCSVMWTPLEQGHRAISLRYEAGNVHNGWYELLNGWSFDGLQSLDVRRDSKDIAVLLLDITGLPKGPMVKYGPNGVLAPSRDLLS